MPVEILKRDVLGFDILDLPGTIAKHRHYLSRHPDNLLIACNIVMAMDLSNDVPTERAQAERKRIYDQMLKRFARVVPHENVRDPDRILRIGYMSADFRQHSAMYAAAPIIGHHDRTKFRVFVYSSTTQRDYYTQAISKSADRFHDVVGWTDQQIAYLIEQEQIDILVDLSGHSAGFRLECLARKPAPVQMSAFGYPLGTGMPTVDYLISDTTFIPEDEAHIYAESMLYMPAFMCYQAPPYTPGVAPLPAASNPITFGVVNRLEKITNETLRVWGKILQAVPSARILFKDRHLSDRDTRRAFYRRLTVCGIKKDRVAFRGVTSHQGQLEVFSEVDIQLDTWPQNGGISSAEALYMGVPVITMRASIPSGRVSASILKTIGHPEWICTTREEYIAKAVALAQSISTLDGIRHKLRADMQGSPFGDPLQYTRILEEKYRQAWQTYVATESMARAVS